jgi:hypothetical protein
LLYYGNSIFIPAAGDYYEKGLEGIGEYSSLWSRNLANPLSAYGFGFDVSYSGTWDNDRYMGSTIRGVIGNDPELGPILPDPAV